MYDIYHGAPQSITNMLHFTDNCVKFKARFTENSVIKKDNCIRTREGRCTESRF